MESTSHSVIQTAPPTDCIEISEQTKKKSKNAGPKKTQSTSEQIAQIIIRGGTAKWTETSGPKKVQHELVNVSYCLPVSV